MDDHAEVLQTLARQQQQQQQTSQPEKETESLQKEIAPSLNGNPKPEQELGQESQQSLQHEHERPDNDADSPRNDSQNLDLAKSSTVLPASHGERSGNEDLLLHQTARDILEQHTRLLAATDNVTVHALHNSGPALVDTIRDSTANGATMTNGTVSTPDSPAMNALESLNSTATSAVAAVSNVASVTRASSVSLDSTSLGTIAVIQTSSDSSGSSSKGATNFGSGLLGNAADADVSDRFEKCPTMIKWPANDWESWLAQEKTHCRWNLIRHRHRDKQVFARGPTASEWTREYHCDHAGHYRDRKNPNIDPSKKRKRAGSIKCNCPAFIKMRKSFSDDDVVIEYYWRHEGHVPDVMEDIKAQRLPQDLKFWIRQRVDEGLDWRTVKGMMTSDSPLLDELHPTTKENIRLLLQASYAQHANTSRQLKNRGNTRPSASAGQSPEAKSADSDIQRPSTASSSSPPPLSSPSKSAPELSLQHTASSSSILPGQGQNPTPGSKDSTSSQTTCQLVPLDHLGNSATQRIRSIDPTADNQTLAVHTLFTESGASSLNGALVSSLKSAVTAESNSKLASASQLEKESSLENHQRKTGGQEQPQTAPQEQQVQRQPRDMMLQMLRAIAELHKQMEATDDYVTQEDAIHIIESFALPIRLMKEALERKNSSR
ncbi:hypothetical protein EDD11_003070 [Mortierella claussenii]|nr:hypothetical protein EDD11_003070 [Mortierella claussenii]